MATRAPAPVVSTRRSATAPGSTGWVLPAVSGLPAAFSAPRYTESAGSTCNIEPAGPRPARPLLRPNGDQRVRELRTASRDLRIPPVAIAAGQCVVENLRPVLELEVRPVGRGAAWLVDPGTRWPTGARPHQRGMQGALGVDGEARHPAVEQRDCAGFEGLHYRWRLLGDDDLGVSEVVGHRRDRGTQACLVPAVDHQHRQCARMTKVGA